MKPMFAAFVAMAIISVAADAVLDGAGYSSDVQNAGSAVRLDNGS